MVREEKMDFFFPMQEPISRLAWALGLAGVCVGVFRAQHEWAILTSVGRKGKGLWPSPWEDFLEELGFEWGIAGVGSG